MRLEEKGDRFYGMMAYALGWLSALYIMRAERRAVRWHAWQSLIVFGGLTLALILADEILPQAPGAWARGVTPTRVARGLVMGGLLFASLGLWIALPLMTLLGRPFLVPLFAPLTLKLAGLPPWTQPTEPWQMGGSSAGSGMSTGLDGVSARGSAVVCPQCNGSGRMTCPRCLASGYERGGFNEVRCTYCIGSKQVQCTGPGPH